MKTHWRLPLCCLLITGLGTPLFAQDQREQEIRQLENLERQSVLQGDTAALFGRLWSPHMVINTPANVVGTVEGTKHYLRTGGLNYLSFTREIEKITFINDVAIVMGGEVIKPQGHQPHAGKTVHRRFTHVWMPSDSGWSIIARQATITKVE
ncbi:hypothetical protein GGR26_002756 [Lewinella marina]|uniref:DUF4440 domain-containing protein n=1 Tax=Neolewinella marina TaxID=438751 RepID=A0A2G0CCX4_9BACT|nr:nuclear transport factor 2 family protein [Neolewinella marina]NJB86979.1 hypothetical protein [Neolewinella marina]PHK97826.1 hypothetical protein CGL56_13505 [Neolewinella marina]